MTPDNNPTERFMEIVKGTKRCQGLLRIGYDVGTMFSKELPDFIYLLVQDKIGVESHKYLLQQEHILRHDSHIYNGLYDYYHGFARSMDTKLITENASTKIYLVNTQDFLGLPITDARQSTYEAAMRGETTLTYTARHTYFQITTSLCTVTGKCVKGKFSYCGSCVDYLKISYCDHAAVFEYADKLDSYCTTIPQRRIKRGKQFDRHTNPKSAMKEKYMTIASLVNDIKNNILKAEGKEERTKLKKILVTVMTTVPNMIDKRKELDNTQVWKIYNKQKDANKTLTLLTNVYDETQLWETVLPTPKAIKSLTIQIQQILTNMNRL